MEQWRRCWRCSREATPPSTSRRFDHVADALDNSLGSVEAIAEHAIDISLGQAKVKPILDSLEYNFGKPTIGAALRRLCAGDEEVNRIVRDKVEVEVEVES